MAGFLPRHVSSELSGRAEPRTLNLGWSGLALLAMLGLGLVTCNREPTSPNPNPATTVGANGGTFVGADGKVSLVFPPGALSKPTTISVTLVTSFPPDPGVVAGSTFQFGPEGTKFAQPVQLTIKYDPSRLSPSVDERSLSLYKVVGEAWEEVKGSSANAGDVSVTGPITSFSIYGVKGQLKPTPVLASLSPSSDTVGDLGLTLRIRGSGFLPSSIVRWDGVDRATTYVSAIELQIVLSKIDLAAVGRPKVTVSTPGVPSSNGLSFCVAPAANSSMFTWPVDCSAVGRPYAEYGPFLSDGTSAYHTGTDIIQASSNPPNADYRYAYTTSVRAAWSGRVFKIFGINPSNDPNHPSQIPLGSELRRWDPSMDTYMWGPPPTQGSNHGLGIAVIIYHPDLQLYTLYGHLDAVIVGLGTGDLVRAGQIIGRMGNSHQEFLRRCPTGITCPAMPEVPPAPQAGLETSDIAGFNPHVHFEVKDRGVLSAERTDDNGPEWGYTRGPAETTPNLPGHPNWFGYHNPMAFLTQVIVRLPQPVTLEVLAFPLHVRDYPGVDASGPNRSKVITEIQPRADGKLPAFVATRSVEGEWYEIYVPNQDEVRQPTVVEGWSASGWIAATVTGVQYSRINSNLPQIIISKDLVRVREDAVVTSGTLVFVYAENALDPQRFVPFESTDGWYRVYLPDKSSKPDGWVATTDAVLAGGSAPTVETGGGTVTSTTATVTANVTPNGLATNAWFEWGTSSDLATPSSTSPQSVGSGTTVVPISADLLGLTPGTTYYYRATASSGAGTAKGAILSFKTPPLALDLILQGSGTGSGHVTSSPALIDCTINKGVTAATGCKGSVTGVPVVTLNVMLWTGSTVTAWDGAGSSCSGPSCDVTMDQSRAVTLTLGGRAGDLNGDGLVDITDLGILLSNWGRTDMPPADINRDGIVDGVDLSILQGNWTGGPVPLVLTVSGAGTGTGTVTSTPAGITCTSTAGATSGTCTASYTNGTSVTLTPTPAAGSEFNGWSGDCTGTGSCALTMTAARSVTATFQTPSTGTGQIAFVSKTNAGYGDIYIMNSDGTGIARLTNNFAPTNHPTWSPDGRRIAFSAYLNGNLDIYVMNADGTGVQRLTDNPADDLYPAWSPDGSKIAFMSSRDDPLYEIYVMNVDGTGVLRLTNNPGAFDEDPAWSPDGSKIAFSRGHLFVMNSDGSGIADLTSDLQAEFQPAWSPDGSRIAFTREVDFPARPEIFVMNADGTGMARLTTDPTLEFGSPTWSPDGSKIAFQGGVSFDIFDIYAINADGTGLVDLTLNSSGGDYQPAWARR